MGRGEDDLWGKRELEDVKVGADGGEEGEKGARECGVEDEIAQAGEAGGCRCDWAPSVVGVVVRAVDAQGVQGREWRELRKRFGAVGGEEEVFQSGRIGYKFRESRGAPVAVEACVQLCFMPGNSSAINCTAKEHRPFEPA